MVRLFHRHRFHQLNQFRIREYIGFELRNSIDLLFEIANSVHGKADTEPVATMVSGHFVVNVRLSGKARVRSTKGLKVHPSETNFLKPGSHFPFPVIVRT
jgi:hypothetical protein